MCPSCPRCFPGWSEGSPRTPSATSSGSRLATPANAAFDVYRALRLVNPGPYMFYIRHPEAVVLGASPETMSQLREGVVVSRPIAGTRWRGRTPEEDAALADELLGDEKERAEHVMLV